MALYSKRNCPEKSNALVQNNDLFGSNVESEHGWKSFDRGVSGLYCSWCLLGRNSWGKRLRSWLISTHFTVILQRRVSFWRQDQDKRQGERGLMWPVRRMRLMKALRCRQQDSDCWAISLFQKGSKPSPDNLCYLRPLVSDSPWQMKCKSIS